MNHIQSPATGDQAIERAIVSAGANVAPRVTPADIEAAIVSEHYFTAEDGRAGALQSAHYDGRECPAAADADIDALKLLTFCVLVLHNGFTVTGESACASPANFNAEIGRRIARENAVQKLWPLLGFRMRDKLAAEALE